MGAGGHAAAACMLSKRTLLLLPSLLLLLLLLLRACLLVARVVLWDDNGPSSRLTWVVLTRELAVRLSADPCSSHQHQHSDGRFGLSGSLMPSRPPTPFPAAPDGALIGCAISSSRRHHSSATEAPFSAVAAVACVAD